LEAAENFHKIIDISQFKIVLTAKKNAVGFKAHGVE